MLDLLNRGIEPLLQVAVFGRQFGEVASQLFVFLAQLIQGGDHRIGFFGKRFNVIEHGDNGINLNVAKMTAFKKILSALIGSLALLGPGLHMAHAQGLLQKAQSVQAQSGGREGLVRAGEVQAGLVAEKTAALAGKPFALGLRIIHDPHWHTYWRNPGDSGLPTSMAWQLPSGWQAGPIQWPTPKRLPVGPLANFGFEGDLLLPVELVVPANATPGPVRLTAKASWLVCKDVCIPGEVELAIVVTVTRDASSIQDTSDAALFARARSAIPKPDTTRVVRAYLADKTLSLVWLSNQASESAGFFYPYTEALIHPAGAQRLVKTADGFRVDIALGEASKSAVQEVQKTKHVEGIWVVSDTAGVAWRAALQSGPAPAEVALVSAGQTAEQAAPRKAESAGWGALGAAMIGALLGGMILNLMPCVFPVIGLKVLSFAQSAHSRAGAIQHALIFASGVIVSFLALAGLLLALRAAGDAVGWGFQLQSPWVVLLLAFLFVAIAVNLFGGFEMGLMGSRVANLSFAERASSSSGALGAFSSGILAVVVASPCTAPFMGSAIGFTATAGIAETLAVFAALGVGMSLPYLVLAAWPGLLERMPRPGLWMVRFKQAMAFPMLAAAAWLFWVLANLQGPQVVLAALIGAIALSLGLWCYGVIQRGGSKIAAGLTLVLMMVLVAYAAIEATRAVSSAAAPTNLSSTGPGVSVSGDGPVSSFAPQNSAAMWQPWAPGLPERLQAQGHTVFVDFTATWCISCQANKVRVLQKESVINAFTQSGVKTVRADWTRRDDQIGAELARHGRNGIPLYLVYPRGGGAPKILSEWLTEKEVMDAIR